MLLDTDLPYLEPLLLWLRNDEELKKHFTEKSFFMPHHDLLEASKEMFEKNCPAPRALWILPQDTSSNQRKEGCLVTGNHSFGIMLITKCHYNSFELVKRDGEIKLAGDFMELSHLRKLVKKSVRRFAKHNMSQVNREFDTLVWERDRNLYPDEDPFLATSIEYTINIYNN